MSDDWADKMAKKFGGDVHVYGTEELHELAGSVDPGEAAAFFREQCIPTSWVEEFLRRARVIEPDLYSPDAKMKNETRIELLETLLKGAK